MFPEWMTFRQVRMIEIVSGIVAHSDTLHDCA
jgi:hypothetical protein